MDMIKNSEKNHVACHYFSHKGLSSHTLHLSASLTMKAISSADKANIISLLSSDHSISLLAQGSQLWVAYARNWKWTKKTIKEAASLQLTRGGLPIKLPLAN